MMYVFSHVFRCGAHARDVSVSAASSLEGFVSRLVKTASKGGDLERAARSAVEAIVSLSKTTCTLRGAGMIHWALCSFLDVVRDDQQSGEKRH
jgi:hypothetical protein